MMGRLLSSVVIFTFALQVCQALFWDGQLPEHTYVDVCEGQEIVLPWNYNLLSGEAVSEIKWHYSPEGSPYNEHLIALEAEGQFLTIPFLSQRVYHVPNAGLRLSSASDAVAGTYSVSVSTHFGLSQLLTYTMSATVRVTVPPATPWNQGLTVTQQIVILNHSRSDNSSEAVKWHVQLTCGTFSHLGKPAIDVEWKTPLGIQRSTANNSYEFSLVVPNPVQSGNYSCYLPFSHAVTCLDTYSSLRHGASVFIDEMETRVVMLENVQADLLKENYLLMKENEELQSAQHNLSSLTQNLDNREGQAERQLYELYYQLANLQSTNSYLQEQLTTEQSRNNELLRSVHTLESRLAQLEWLVQNPYAHTSPHYVTNPDVTTDTPMGWPHYPTSSYDPRWWWTTQYYDWWLITANSTSYRYATTSPVPWWLQTTVPYDPWGWDTTTASTMYPYWWYQDTTTANPSLWYHTTPYYYYTSPLTTWRPYYEDTTWHWWETSRHW